MADFTYAAVLALIHVMEKTGIAHRWPDFQRAYDLPDMGLEPPSRPRTGYEGPLTAERMRRLRELHRGISEPKVLRFFERLAQSVLADLDEPAHARLPPIAPDQQFLTLLHASSPGVAYLVPGNSCKFPPDEVDSGTIVWYIVPGGDGTWLTRNKTDPNRPMLRGGRYARSSAIYAHFLSLPPTLTVAYGLDGWKEA